MISGLWKCSCWLKHSSDQTFRRKAGQSTYIWKRGRKEGENLNEPLTLFHKEVGAKEVAPVWLGVFDLSYHIISMWAGSVLTGEIWNFPWLNQKSQFFLPLPGCFSGLFLRIRNCEMRGIELPTSKEVLCNSFVFLKSVCFAKALKLLTLFLEDRVFYQLLCLLCILK